VRKISSAGIIRTLAGDFTPIFAGDGGPASSAWVRPEDITSQPDGSVLFVDSANRVRRIAPDGTIDSIIGRSTNGAFTGDGGPATLADFNAMRSLAIGPDGSIFVGDSANYRIRRVSPDGIVSTYAGSGRTGAFLATEASRSMPLSRMHSNL
jgi:serine/threonine-protein kinase